MDYFISTDPFWTTIVEYLDYKDIYNLSILSKHFDQTIDVRKILLRKINKGLNLTFGDQENKIKKILMDFNCYISGKFVERLFKSSENYHDSTFVFVTYYGFQDTTFIKDLSVKYGIFLSGYLMSQPNNNQLFILVPQENYEDVEKIVHSKWGYLPIERKFPFCRREPFKHKVLLTSSSNKYVEFLKIVDPLKLTHIQKHPHSDFGQMLIIKGAWLFGKN